MAVTLTETAAKHVASQLANRGKGVGIRIGVTTTGCSGMAYVLEFVDEPTNFDGATVATMKDPEGNYVQLLQFT